MTNIKKRLVESRLVCLKEIEHGKTVMVYYTPTFEIWNYLESDLKTPLSLVFYHIRQNIETEAV